MKKINIAILGQGRSGRNIHAHALTTVGRMRELFDIRLVCDPIHERLLPTSNETGCDISQNWRDVLQRRDIDLVVNCTPSDMHVPISKELLESGHNVLCEKPLASSAADVDALASLALSKNCTLAAFQQMRFAPYYKKIRNIIDSGCIGRIIQIKCAFNTFGRRWDWQTVRSKMAGSLLNTGPHPIDQALQFMHGVTPNVTCRMDKVNVAGDAESHVKLLLWGRGAPIIDIEVSMCSPYTGYTYQISGENGAVTGTLDKIEWKWFDPREMPMKELTLDPLPGLQYCTEDLPWKSAIWTPENHEKDLFPTATSRLYENIYNHIVHGAKLEVTLADARKQIAIIEECHKQNPINDAI